MKFIAHRGNIVGSQPLVENSQSHLQMALDKGFDVEVDLWVNEDWSDIRAGHDEALYVLDEDFMLDNRNTVWYHAKNFTAVDFCLKENFNVFWQHNDSYAVTSFGYVWHHGNVDWPNDKYRNLNKSIVMLAGHPNDYHSLPTGTIHAICTPYALDWKIREEKTVNYEKIHKGFLESGMFWEYFSELSGNWNEDKYDFCILLHKRFDNDTK